MQFKFHSSHLCKHGSCFLRNSSQAAHGQPSVIHAFRRLSVSFTEFDVAQTSLAQQRLSLTSTDCTGLKSVQNIFRYFHSLCTLRLFKCQTKSCSVFQTVIKIFQNYPFSASMSNTSACSMNTHRAEKNI